jgi:hypothetical protein
VQRTSKDEKVQLASFYMDGDAQQWYFCVEHNQGALAASAVAMLVKRIC